MYEGSYMLDTYVTARNRQGKNPNYPLIQSVYYLTAALPSEGSPM